MLERERHRIVVGLVVVCTLLLGAALLQPRSLLRTAVDLTNSRAFVAVVLALYVGRPFLAVPMSLVTVVVGWRYGLVVGLPIAVAGTVVTTYLPYLLGRYYRTDSGPFGWLSRMGERAFDVTGGLRGMVASRLAPAPADGVSYGAGVAGVAPSTYVLGTVLGELPWTLGYLLIGRSMQALTLEAVEVDYRVLVVAALVALLVVAPPVVSAISGLTR